MTPEPSDVDATAQRDVATLRALILEAITAWPQLDSDEPISGADLTEWFVDWRLRAVDLLRDPRDHA